MDTNLLNAMVLSVFLIQFARAHKPYVFENEGQLGSGSKARRAMGGTLDPRTCTVGNAGIAHLLPSGVGLMTTRVRHGEMWGK